MIFCVQVGNGRKLCVCHPASRLRVLLVVAERVEPAVEQRIVRTNLQVWNTADLQPDGCTEVASAQAGLQRRERQGGEGGGGLGGGEGGGGGLGGGRAGAAAGHATHGASTAGHAQHPGAS